jgi:hypothetical protein
MNDIEDGGSIVEEEREEADLSSQYRRTIHQ